MRDISKRTRVLAAVTVVAALALVPVQAEGGRRTVADRVPGVSVLIKVLAPTASKPPVKVAAPAPVAKAPAERAVAPAPKPESQAVEVDVPFDKGIREMERDTFEDPFAMPPGSEPSSGPCAKATTCPSYQLRQFRWKTDDTGKVTIPWKFNDEGRRNLRAPAGLLESATRSSMAQWSRWNSNIAFSYAGTTAAKFAADGKDGSCTDGTNVVTWDRFDPSVIAVAAMCMDRTGRVIRDADLALNVSFHWEDVRGEPESRHSFDIRSIVTHELGHWLGLIDLYSSSDVHQTMSGYSKYGEASKRTLALGDIIGIQTAYPCSNADACPRSGIADD
jgi:hypothetical protein